MEIDSFVVKQERGQDSWVNIEESFIYGYPEDRKALIFTTDQSLNSNSDRAWNVEKAIERYANERGYKVQKPYEDKFKVIAIYDKGHHSSMLEFKLRKEIENDPAFLEAKQEAQDKVTQLNRQHGKHINELKRLAFLLEEALRVRMKEVAMELVETQRSIIETMNTEGIMDYHMFADKHPLVKIEPDYYYKRTDHIPDNLDDILALLD